MTKDHDIIDAQEPTMEEVGDSLKAWLAGGQEGDTAEAANASENAPQEDVRPADTPNGSEPQDDIQEPQDGPVEPAPEEDTADSPKAAEEPEDAPQEDVSETDTLKQAYAALEAKVAELEAREAARLEAQEKTNALTEAGIKGDYSALLNGPKDQWAGQIALLKEFAAENGRAVSVPRDPAVDADVWSEPKEISAEEFLRSRSNEW
jgi:hypothetical protein